MNAVEIIIKKRDHGELSQEEIEFFVKGFTDGSIPDYQASALAMAIMLNGMTYREVTNLTLCMANSGTVLHPNNPSGNSVDKHSTGGVGDKTSLVVLPVVSACGLPIGKMSGRGLGFSGGTLDKMESIPGYRCSLTPDEFETQLAKIGIVLAGQSQELAPADGKFYALRDVTGTVPSIPLIASSIMSKKIAAGANSILLDVKIGLGAFMQSLDQGRELAHVMTAIGRLAGRKVVALLSDMNQPLGWAVGNSLEVKEAIQVLNGTGPKDFIEHCLVLSAHMLELGLIASNLDHGRSLAENALANGEALEKFRQLVAAQNGDVSFVDDLGKFGQAKFVVPITAQSDGWIAQVHAGKIGEATVLLGAGRLRKEDSIDHSVGLVCTKKVGDFVKADEMIYEVHANSEERLEQALELLAEAVILNDNSLSPLPLFYS